jgi:hypothetical protein
VLAGLSVAAAVLIIAALGTVLINQRSDLRDTQDQLAAAQASDDAVTALLADPGTTVVGLTTEHGTTDARALVGADGESVLLAAGLPDLGSDRTYQLWGLPTGREAMVSLAVLGADPEQSEFHVEGGITTLAITEEPGGGSTQPSNDPLVSGTIV